MSKAEVYHGPHHATRTLFFGNADQTGAQDALMARSENFVAMEPAGDLSAKISFMANSNAAAVDTVTVSFQTGVTFMQACKAFADILNKTTHDKHTVVADEKAGIYAYPFTGTVAVTEG